MRLNFSPLLSYYLVLFILIVAVISNVISFHFLFSSFFTSNNHTTFIYASSSSSIGLSILIFNLYIRFMYIPHIQQKYINNTHVYCVLSFLFLSDFITSVMQIISVILYVCMYVYLLQIHYYYYYRYYFVK